MRDNSFRSRITATVLSSGLVLAIVLGPALSTIAQDKPTPADTLKAAVAIFTAGRYDMVAGVCFERNLILGGYAES